MEVISEIESVNCLDLLTYIGWKDEYPDEAQSAFTEFCLRFDRDVLKKAEIFCSKWNYNETVALDIAKCTFAKVWKYPTYNHQKSNAKDVVTGIKLWLYKIVFTQLANHNNKGTCFEPDEESDLSLIYTTDDLINRIAQDELSKKTLKKQLIIVDEALSKLSSKHKVIYLTYKLYRSDKGKYIPRKVSKKLQNELNLASGSIRKYLEEANKQVQFFLNNN